MAESMGAACLEPSGYVPGVVGLQVLDESLCYYAWFRAACVKSKWQ